MNYWWNHDKSFQHFIKTAAIASYRCWDMQMLSNSFNSLPGQFQEIKESLLVMIQNLFTIKMWLDWIGNLLHKSPAMVSEIFLNWFLEFNITNKAK